MLKLLSLIVLAWAGFAAPMESDPTRNDRVSTVGDNAIRDLQGDSFEGSIGPLPVESTCQAYENFQAEPYDCECGRQGRRGVLVKCQKVDANCVGTNDDVCLSNRFESLVNPITTTTTGTNYSESCSLWTYKQYEETTNEETQEVMTEEVDPLIFEACVKIVPEQTGVYDGPFQVRGLNLYRLDRYWKWQCLTTFLLLQCSATLGGGGCNSCRACTGGVTVDCSNRGNGAIMSCITVNPSNGLAAVVFDEDFDESTVKLSSATSTSIVTCMTLLGSWTVFMMMMV